MTQKCKHEVKLNRELSLDTLYLGAETCVRCQHPVYIFFEVKERVLDDSKFVKDLINRRGDADESYRYLDSFTDTSVVNLINAAKAVERHYKGATSKHADLARLVRAVREVRREEEAHKEERRRKVT